MSKPKIVICIGSSCFSRGNAKNAELAEEFLKKHNLRDEVDVELSGGLCLNMCAEGPNVVIDGRVHHHVDQGAMLDLLENLFPGDENNNAGEKVQ